MSYVIFFTMNEKYIKDYFKFDCKPKANQDAIIEGVNYRFTLLTSRLIRMEYNENGNFEDRPTQTIWYRDLEIPEFKLIEEGNFLIIATQHLRLEYNTSKKFKRSSLEIIIKNTGKKWKYGKREQGNLSGTKRTLDGSFRKVKLEKGLLSKDGYATLDDSESLVFDENQWLTGREDDAIDLYFFGHGRDYLGALSDYYKVSGKTPMIPRYILGNWWSRYWEYDEQELKELINTFYKHQIPLSVCIIDMDWHLVDIDPKYGSGWTGYTWNKEFFPDPEHMLDWLHDRDLKTSLNLHPADGIRGHEDCYEEVADFMGVDKSNEEPVKFDIADPKFVSAYFDLVHHPLEEQGVDFWWIDWQQGTKTNMEGLDPLWMLNHLHFFDQGRSENRRSFIFSRWGGYGNHRYPIGFSGDTVVNWKVLDFQPYFTTTASNVGYGWWSHDIGGHMLGSEDVERYIRWVQFGVFSPILRLHSTKKKFHKREPWRFDQNALKYASDMLRLRHQLIPYIYTMAYVNYNEDIPLMRPLYYFKPHDENAYEYQNEYWYGSELIAHPITDEIHKKFAHILHETYLPEQKGGFFNLFTKEYHEGGEIFTRAYKLSEVPVFAKAGAIIPLANDGVKNGTKNPVHMKIDIYPGASNKFSLYEDEGDSERYKQGEFSLTEINLDWTDSRSTITITKENKKLPYIPNERSYTVVLNCIDDIDQIEMESDTELDLQKEIDLEHNQIVVSIPSNNFSAVTISLTNPTIKKANYIEDQMHQMLMDCKLSTLTKMFLDNRVFKRDKYADKHLKRLYWYIRFLR